MKILIVLEGERTESSFFQSILAKFDLKADLYIVGTNLYTLYHKCKDYDFECDVRDVLKELVKDNETKMILEQKFAYTYLVFDADLHHKAPEQRGIDVQVVDLVTANFPKLIEMAKHFSNETDPSIGRLYINYPMMESFRYCDKFDDNDKSKIQIDSINVFKELASKRKLAGIPIIKYTKADFINLIKMNIKRLESLLNDYFDSFPTYQIYQTISESQRITLKQYEMIQNEQQLHVINTSIFIILDYFGNRNNFYDDIIS